MTQPEALAPTHSSKSVFDVTMTREMQKRGYIRLIRLLDGATVAELTPLGHLALANGVISL